MKILPRRTFPPSITVDRRHNPKVTRARFGYRQYRTCLRWDFGFSCAFCLLHESDFRTMGAEGLGLMSIEHFIPVSVDRSQANSYENCFYCCRLCNEARSNTPLRDGEGRRLLNPCRDDWGSHYFLSEDDRLLPAAGSSDACYTLEVYDLNDPRKIEMRRVRQEDLADCLEVITQAPDLLESVLVACRRAETRQEMGRLVSLARMLLRKLFRAARELRRRTAIPRDADAACRCGHTEYHLLPGWLDAQTQDLDFDILAMT
jgi:hypothetical protein